jgi:hypothetical protein
MRCTLKQNILFIFLVFLISTERNPIKNAYTLRSWSFFKFLYVVAISVQGTRRKTISLPQAFNIVFENLTKSKSKPH